MIDDGGGLIATKISNPLKDIQEKVVNHFLHTYDVTVDKVSMITKSWHIKDSYYDTNSIKTEFNTLSKVINW